MEHKNKLILSLRAKLLTITTTIVIAAFAFPGVVILIIMRTSEQKTIADGLDANTNGCALTVNELIAARMAMVTSTLQTIPVDDKPFALTIMNLPYKGGEFFRFPTMGLEDKTVYMARADGVGQNPLRFDPTSRPW